MGHSFIFALIFPIIFGAMGLFYFVIGMRGIITRKPFLVSSRWMFYMLVFCFFPIMLSPFFFSQHGHLSASSLQALLFICFFIYVSILRRGYMAFGITNSSLREALLDSLRKMNIAYEETIGSIKLPSVGAELQVSMQGWVGIGQIRIKPYSSNQVLVEIAKATNTYFQENNTGTNVITCVLYVVTSLFMIIPSFFIGSTYQHLGTQCGGTKSYYDSGAVRFEYQYAHGKREGVAREYFPNGKIKREWPYHNGDINGITKEYYQSGELRYVYTYQDDEQEGPTKEFYKDGRLKAEGMYINGQLNGTSKGYSEEGKLIWAWPYKNGQQHGICRSYYDTGELKEEYIYVNGKQEGPVKEFYKDGRVKIGDKSTKQD